MAEESLAFYVLIITVMIAAGYDAMVGAAVILLGCRHRCAGLDGQPVRHRIASGFADVPISDGIVGRLVILVVGLAMGSGSSPLRGAGAAGPIQVAGVRHEGRQRSHFSAATDGAGDVEMTRQQKTILALFAGRSW